MATFQKAKREVLDLVNTVLCDESFHQPLLDAKVKIDVLMMYAPTDDNEKPKGFAMRKRGRRVLGQTRKIPLDQRVKGAGDVEIKLDGDWWEEANDRERCALVDHELTHICVQTNSAGVAKTDDIMRPLISLREHDVELHCFARVADKWKEASQERKQAEQYFDAFGQAIWPFLVNK